MKTKKVILGMAVFAFAIGSAFASLSLDPDTWVKVLVEDNGSCLQPKEECRKVTDPIPSCNDAADSDRCEVRVSTQAGQKTTSETYKDAGCDTPIMHSGGIIDVTLEGAATVCDVLP